jgi:acetyltransferase-like isoleucine patch superfamily enzyme
MGSTIAAGESITLEENVILARNVFITDHAHAFQDVERPIRDQGIDGVSPVVIGRNSWLGQNAVILAGVTVGQHCVIGANAVVRDSIPDFCVAVGAPARVVKRFNSTLECWEAVKSVAKAG